MIEVKQAYWKSKDKDDILKEYEITTIVLYQNDIYFDPSDDDFLDKIFKEYARNYLKDDEIELKLSKRDIFYYGENANVYLLNYIYNKFFPTKKQNPFNPILESDEGSINLTLFNGLGEQVFFLIEILEKMEIDFKKLSEDCMLLSFPDSLSCYKDDEIEGLRYEEWKI